MSLCRRRIVYASSVKGLCVQTMVYVFECMVNVNVLFEGHVEFQASIVMILLCFSKLMNRTFSFKNTHLVLVYFHGTSVILGTLFDLNIFFDLSLTRI